MIGPSLTEKIVDVRVKINLGLFVWEMHLSVIWNKCEFVRNFARPIAFNTMLFDVLGVLI